MLCAAGHDRRISEVMPALVITSPNRLAPNSASFGFAFAIGPSSAQLYGVSLTASKRALLFFRVWFA